ncbi:hypothetical protein CSQ87_02860 [Bifidobacterium simiarum]|uniref:Uncharacterized protein n=1 Tax=Bifidobacterium simiarum TaxID=2045441 RepID=A0A2M9HG92_9BIFI|nr:hypothetical protein CSQ87_02860 [Bifidobacterium simiarum]
MAGSGCGTAPEYRRVVPFDEGLDDDALTDEVLTDDDRCDGVPIDRPDDVRLADVRPAGCRPSDLRPGERRAEGREPIVRASGRSSAPVVVLGRDRRSYARHAFAISPIYGGMVIPDPDAIAVATSPPGPGDGAVMMFGVPGSAVGEIGMTVVPAGFVGLMPADLGMSDGSDIDCAVMEPTLEGNRPSGKPGRKNVDKWTNMPQLSVRCG